MVFSKTHSLFDRLALVIIYDSIGYIGCLTAILGALLGTTNMRLHPVEASWATQLDRQHKKSKKEKKQERQKDRDHHENVRGYFLIINRMHMPKKR